MLPAWVTVHISVSVSTGSSCGWKLGIFGAGSQTYAHLTTNKPIVVVKCKSYP